MKTTTFPLKHSIRSSCTLASLLIPLALVCFALVPNAKAVVPAPDGGYPNNNTAEGQDALFSVSTGTDNTALGFDALFNNTTGGQNTATGANALTSNTIGEFNTASGASALFSNTTGSYNTAAGDSALNNNTIGHGNTANGASALLSNTAGFNNTANGVSALFNNTTGIGNTANGATALFSNTTGDDNTATGFGALSNSTSAIYNTAIGFQALQYNTTGGGNIALGYLAGSQLTTGSHNIDIGHRGVAGESGTIRIGKQGTQTATFVAGISGVTVSTGVPIIVDSSGHLGTTTSSARFKEAVKPMEKASEVILALKPVTFRYKHELDPEGGAQFGLVAEEVEKVNPDLVARDEQGKPYTVRYEAVNAMLLNEFIKARRQIDSQQKQIEALTAGLQKVRAQLELSKPVPQTVLNKQ
jgi:hypothetical protein